MKPIGKMNIVIYNLEESKSEQGPEQIYHNHSQVSSLLQTIGLTNTIKEYISTLRRLGKLSNQEQQASNEEVQPPTADTPTPSKPRPSLISLKAL